MADSNNPIKSALRHNLSSVASSSKKSVAILVVIIGILGYILYTTIFSLSGPGQNDLVKAKQLAKPPANVVVPDSNVIVATSQVPDIPAIPQLVKPTPPAPPPAPKPEPKKEDTITKPSPVATVKPNAAPAPVAPTSVAPIELPTTRKPLNQMGGGDADSRRKTGIMLINNPPKTAAAVEQAQIVQDTSFKARSNLRYVLGKGKIMEVILETAINTDQAGEIRGIIARDVFAEDHKTRLIPKGSKIFGTFSNAVDDVYGILKVNWTRVDLATGYTLQLVAAGSIDNLGRTGIVGRLDNKYKEQIIQSAVSSAINVGLAQAMDKLVTASVNTVESQKYSGLASSLGTLNTTFVSQMTPLVTSGSTAAALSLINTTCQTAKGYFFDTTISAYTDLDTACKNVTSSTTTVSDNYAGAMTTISAALQAASSAVSSLSNSNTSTTLTTTQSAVKTAIQSLTTQVQGFTTNKTYSANITIAQGEMIRVYIDQDYTFPAKAVGSFTSVLQ